MFVFISEQLVEKKLTIKKFHIWKKIIDIIF